MGETTMNIEAERQAFERVYPVSWGVVWAVEYYAPTSPYTDPYPAVIHNALWNGWLSRAPQDATRIAELEAEQSRLTECLKKANSGFEEFERKWYLRGDEIEKLEAKLAAAQRLRDALKILHDENMDYIKLNNLGAENNQSLRMARKALDAFDKETGK